MESRALNNIKHALKVPTTSLFQYMLFLFFFFASSFESRKPNNCWLFFLFFFWKIVRLFAQTNRNSHIYHCPLFFPQYRLHAHLSCCKIVKISEYNQHIYSLSIPLSPHNDQFTNMFSCLNTQNTHTHTQSSVKTTSAPTFQCVHE